MNAPIHTGTTWPIEAAMRHAAWWYAQAREHMERAHETRFCSPSVVQWSYEHAAHAQHVAALLSARVRQSVGVEQVEVSNG